MVKWNYILPLCLVALLLAFGYRGFNKSLPQTASQDLLPEEQTADYFLEQATIKRYDARGVIEYQLVSDSVSHYDYNDTTLLTRPYMTSYKEEGKTTDTQALNGKLLSGNETLLLWDNVVMTQMTTGQEKKVQLDTEFLTVYPNKGTAETEYPVLITTDDSHVKAIGMHTIYDIGLINLKSRVRGIYEPI